MNKNWLGSALFLSPLLLVGHFGFTVAQQSLAPHYFPFWVYLELHGMVRLPGYQDIQYGSCRFLHCDEAAFAAATMTSLALYGLAACLGLGRDRGQSRGQG